MSRRTPLARALGLGSAKEGTGHWWSQRVSAVALVPLGLWFVFSLALMAGSGELTHDGLVAWVAAPASTVLLLSLVGTLCYHSQLGVQVVIEDYVHVDWLKVTTLIALKFAHALLAVAAAYAVLRIGLGGAG